MNYPLRNWMHLLVLVSFIKSGVDAAMCISCLTEDPGITLANESATLFEALGSLFKLPRQTRNCRETTVYRGGSRPSFRKTDRVQCESGGCTKIKGSFSVLHAMKHIPELELKPEDEEFVIRGCWEDLWLVDPGTLDEDFSDACWRLPILTAFHTKVCVCLDDLCNAASAVLFSFNQRPIFCGFTIFWFLIGYFLEHHRT